MIRLSGLMAGRRVVREVPLDLPDAEPRHDVLASLWARARIDDLTGQDMTSRTLLGQDLAATEAAGAARGAEVRKAITQLGLDYRLMTQYTSFVAIEELTVTEGGEARRIEVPVEMPEGVSYEGVFGSETPALMAMAPTAPGMGFEHSLRADARRMNPGSLDAPRMAGAPPAKLHPTVAAVLERLKAGRATPTAEEARFVRDGKAEVQLWLTDTTAETMARLRKLGVEVVVQPKTAKLVIARVPLEKLAALAELAVVRYVAPQTAGL